MISNIKSSYQSFILFTIICLLLLLLLLLYLLVIVLLTEMTKVKPKTSKNWSYNFTILEFYFGKMVQQLKCWLISLAVTGKVFWCWYINPQLDTLFCHLVCVARREQMPLLRILSLLSFYLIWFYVKFCVENIDENLSDIAWIRQKRNSSCCLQHFKFSLLPFFYQIVFLTGT